MTLAVAVHPAVKNSGYTGSTPTTTVSNTFSPGAGDVIVVTSWTQDGYQNDWDAGKPTITDSLGTHLTWNSVSIQYDNSLSANSCRCAVWWAYTASAQTNMTVSVTDSCTGQYTQCLDVAVQCWSGAGTVSPIGAVTAGNNTVATTLSVSITPTADGSALLLSGGSGSASGSATAGTGCYLADASGDMCAGQAWLGTSGGPALTSGALAAQTLSLAAGASTSWQYVAYEVLPPVPLSVSTTSLPQAWTNVAYSYTVQAAGGAGGDTWTVSSGSLPGWASMSSGGVITGTPTANGSSTFTVKVTDSSSATATQVLTLTAGTHAYLAGLATDTVTGGHFTDQNGNPILWVASETWGLPLRAGEWTSSNWQADYDNFFAARAAQGVTVTMLDPVGPGSADTSSDPPNPDGETWDSVNPFTTGTDPTSGLNSTFWTRIDYLVSSARYHGITIGFSINCEYDDASGGVMSGWTTTQFQAYGTALGTRYGSSPNIVWLFGNDAAPGTFDTDFNSVLTGLTGAGANQLVGAWWEAEYTSRYNTSANTANSWGVSHSQFNFCYTYNASYWVLEYAYGEVANQGASVTLPAVIGDGYFYQGGSAYSSTLDRAQRQDWWWALADGARGILTESENVFPWTNSSAETAYTTNWSWVNNLPYLVSFFTSLTHWHRLMPDLSSTFVTAGRGTKVSGYTSGGSGGQYEPAFTNSWVAASVTPEGDLAVCYLPNATTVTVNTARLAPGWTASWVDPVTGAVSSAGTGTSYNSTAKGSNSQGDPDWVLVFQSPQAQPAPVTALVSRTWLERWKPKQKMQVQVAPAPPPGATAVSDSDTSGPETDSAGTVTASLAASDTFGPETDSAGTVTASLSAADASGPETDSGGTVTAALPDSDASGPETDSTGTANATLSDTDAGHGTDGGESAGPPQTSSFIGSALVSATWLTRWGRQRFPRQIQLFSPPPFAGPSDSDSVHGTDSGFAFISDSDASGPGADSGVLLPSDSDASRPAADLEWSKWPSDSDLGGTGPLTAHGAELAGWSGPLADTDASNPAAEAVGPFPFSDTDPVHGTDAGPGAGGTIELIDIYTFQPPFRYSDGGYEVRHGDGTLLWSGRFCDAAVLRLQAAVNAGTVSVVRDSDACAAAETGDTATLQVTLLVTPAVTAAVVI